jgi:hypothetical protein
VCTFKQWVSLFERVLKTATPERHRQTLLAQQIGAKKCCGLKSGFTGALPCAISVCAIQVLGTEPTRTSPGGTSILVLR